MNEPDADGQLPPVAVPFQPTGPKYLHLMPVVLLEPPDARRRIFALLCTNDLLISVAKPSISTPVNES